jgi:hypothetical protein
VAAVGPTLDWTLATADAIVEPHNAASQPLEMMMTIMMMTGVMVMIGMMIMAMIEERPLADKADLLPETTTTKTMFLRSLQLQLLPLL